MTDELLQKLKDAGFPQTEEPNVCGHCGDGGPDTGFKHPTAQELFEACRSDLHFIFICEDQNGFHAWTVSVDKGVEPRLDSYFGDGKTILEALAYLYLTLKEQKKI